MTWLWIIAGLALLTVFYVGWSMRRRKRKLSKGARKRIESLIDKMHAIKDPLRQLFEADAVLDKALSELKFEGSLADKLKKAGPRLKNIDSIWKAHKLRNHIAHEAGVQVNGNEVGRAVKVLEKAIRSLY